MPVARGLLPDEVQLNIPLRPCAVPPLSADEMERIQAAFAGLPTIMVHTAGRPEAIQLDAAVTRRRRPREGRVITG